MSVANWLTGPPQMQPVAAARTWPIPAIETVNALAEWLEVTVEKLYWFADLRGLAFKNHEARLRHYHYRILAKISGNIRLIESPKPELKRLQRKILAEILEKIPSHPAAHGFLKARSIKTFTLPHAGQRVVLRMDVQDFFPSFTGARIQSFFRAAGYPESVADLLGGLCTTVTPRDIWGRSAFGEDPLHLWESRREPCAFYFQRHLPQGAPSSPALANLCSFRMDCRLAGLAASAGAAYTRYADDLAFSGNDEFESRVERFAAHVASIAAEEGFSIHHRKTRIMRSGTLQHLAGLTVNRHVNIRRTDFDRLKATLTNCVRSGPESQNRHGHSQFRSHLDGKVGYVEMINPARGKRLRAIFEQIRWT
ncbi:MAG TPA: reverse transcriptase family protein [Candidatus Angelobacter sp.]|nr:reverse transcriptase family protein [Candidatus Angelobacter sp.]